MSKHLLVLCVAIFVACNASPPTPEPAPEASPPQLAIRGSAAWNQAHGIRYTPEQIDKMRAPRVSAPDTRTPDQIANAACAGASGWACPSRHALLKAGPTPTTPASWTVPNWYADPANSTGCASNNNSCTSSSCGTAGIGPCATVQEIPSHRWGVSNPILAQNTTVTVLSAETLGQEHITLNPLMVTGTVFGVIDTPTLRGTITLGTVAAKNRATGTLLSSTGFTVGVQNDLLVNNTHASHARIYSIAGGTATISQPLAPITIAGASDFPSAMPVEVDNWTTGDSVSVYSLPLLNLDQFLVQGGQAPASTIGGTSWVQNVHIADTAGSNGSSYFNVGDQSSLTVPWLVDCTVDAFTIVHGPTAAGDAGSFAINDIFDGGMSISDGSMIGGACTTFGCGIYQFGVIDGDAIAASGLNNGLNAYEQGFFGMAYAANGSSIFNGARMKLDPIWYTNTFLWGAGTLNIQDTSSLEKVTGNTWVQTMLLAGGVTIDGSGTATKYAAGTWTDGIAVTPANVDTNQGLQNPKTGAKLCNPN